MASTSHEFYNPSNRLIRIIEVNAEELTRGTVENLQSNPRTISYHELSYSDLYNRAYEVYHDLARWLWEKSDQAIQAWYNELGKERFHQRVPLGEVLWALVLTKYRLLDYLRAWGLPDSAMELYQQQEFSQMIGQFFDRAICYTAEGYERETSFGQKPSHSNAA
ncbi:MAG: hypothetical protein ACRDHZ_11710 [Ktedonobacteraceae bacterium]